MSHKKLTCGSCSGLNREKLINGASKCSSQGVLPVAKACSKYRPDAFALAPLNSSQDENNDLLHRFATCISDFSTAELQVLAGLLLAEKKTRKYGFSFWQKIYCRVSGSSADFYVNNFVVGRVLDANREHLRVVSETGKSCLQYLIDPDLRSFYTVKEFQPLLKDMKAKGKLVDPNTQRPAKRHLDPLDFAMESVPDDFSKGRSYRKSQRVDLVSIVRKMSSGHILKKTDADYTHSTGEISIHHR